MTSFMASSSSAAATKPTIGETSSEMPTFVAWDHSTPLVAEPAGAMNWLARPTPMIEPTMVWELEAGRPRNHVPRFHNMAATSRANTMAKPADDPTCRISSTGSSDMMPKATAPVEVSTPRKLKKPDHITANSAGSERV